MRKWIWIVGVIAAADRRKAWSQLRDQLDEVSDGYRTIREAKEAFEMTAFRMPEEGGYLAFIEPKTHDAASLELISNDDFEVHYKMTKKEKQKFLDSLKSE